MNLIQKLKTYSESLELSEDKKELLNCFLSNGFPTIKNEEWKYTSLKKIVETEYTIEDLGRQKLSNRKELDEAIEKVVKKNSLGFENRIVFVDGAIIKKPNINGVRIDSYSDFKSKTADSILQLNAALAKNGFTISVEENIVLEKPIEILFLQTEQLRNSFCQFRNLIHVGDNSNVKFIEQIQNLHNTNSLVNHFTQINCGKNTSVEYNKIQNNTSLSRLIDTVNIYQSQDSTCNINTLIFGGSFVRNNLNFEQNGSNCESNMNGISILDGSQLADNHTFVDHKNAYCRSNEMYKGVYFDSSKGVFNGKIMVRPNAQKIDAFQANNNLLLSENSTIDSKPQLEIYADDVKCSHGCTIGQLDEKALFYMRSRGIGKEAAKAVLTYAFASEAINNISLMEVRLLAQKLLTQKLNVDLNFNV